MLTPCLRGRTGSNRNKSTFSGPNHPLKCLVFDQVHHTTHLKEISLLIMQTEMWLKASDWKAQGVPSSGYTTMGLMYWKYWFRFCEALFLGQVQTSKAKDSGTVSPLRTMVTLWRTLDVHGLYSLQCLCTLSVRYTSGVCFNTEDGRFGIFSEIVESLEPKTHRTLCISK